MGTLTKLREWWQSDGTATDPVLELAADGFRIHYATGVFDVRWDDVLEIRAYKLDLITIDEVRFDFSLPAGVVATINEEQTCFHTVIDAAQRRFPGIAGWQHRVIKPAFERNETVLYSRGGSRCGG